MLRILTIVPGMRSRRPRRLASLCFLWMAAGSAAVVAQPTNAEVFQSLALQCLAAAPDTVHAFRLVAPATMPYVRTALVDRWTAGGYAVFAPDSIEAAPPLARFAYDVEEATVRYDRAGRRRIDRHVTLGVRHRLTGRDGRLLAEEACRETYEDTVARSAIADVEQDAFPETVGQVPRAGWIRRFLEPAVVVAATAVGVYLFFTLRSESGAGG